MFDLNKKRGSIAITIVMMVFCFLMAVSMSYQKTIQTEFKIRNSSNYSERAVDAAFSGLNYAMAALQTKKNIFNYHDKVKITVASDGSKNINSKWINLDEDFSFEKYYEEERKFNGDVNNSEKRPPYRFIVSCNENSYYETNINGLKTYYVLIKSLGQYYKYDGNNIETKYTAQLMGECELDNFTRTIRLVRYRRMQPQVTFDEENGSETIINNFYAFDGNEVERNRFYKDY